MSRWFRMYDEALDDEKLNFLSDKSFRGWFKLLCLASKNDGVLPPLKHIAFRLRSTEQVVSRLLDELCSAGLIDPVEVADAPMSYEPHNWKGRQYKSDVSTGRVKRFRNGKRNADETFQKRREPVSETAPDTEQIQKQKDAADAAPEKQVYALGKNILGASSGGLIKKLIAAKDGNLTLAHAALLTAKTKSDPREFLGAIIRAREAASCRPDRSF